MANMKLKQRSDPWLARCLVRALRKKNLFMFRFYLFLLEDVNVSYHGNSLLHWAIVCGNIDAVRILLMRGARIEGGDTKDELSTAELVKLCIAFSSADRIIRLGKKKDAMRDDSIVLYNNFVYDTRGSMYDDETSEALRSLLVPLGEYLIKFRKAEFNKYPKYEHQEALKTISSWIGDIHKKNELERQQLERSKEEEGDSSS